MLFTDIFIPFKLVGPLAKMATLIINLRCFSVAIALSLMSLSSFAYFISSGPFCHSCPFAFAEPYTVKQGSIIH